MLYIMAVGFQVEDYERFKASFDIAEAAAERQAGGAISYQIFCTVEDPNKLVLLFTWDNLEKYQQFMQSPALRERMERAGVLNPGERYALKKVAEGAP